MTEQEILKKLSNYSTPELCDGAGPDGYRTMAFRIQRQITDEKIVGTAFTVQVPYGGGGIVPDAILAANKGDVLVIAAENSGNAALWGDHRSLCALRKGLAGVVIDGAYRDLEGCAKAGFPIFATNITPGGGGKKPEGALNVPVVCGDIEVHPGDYIVGDENGVIVIRPEEAEVIMERADRKMRAEAATIRKMEETGEILPRVLMELA